MRISPTFAAARESLVAAGQTAAAATYTSGATTIVQALLDARAHVDTAARMLDRLAPADPTAAATMQAIEGIRTQLDAAISVTHTIDRERGRLPIGLVDPLFDGIEQASDLLFASRWG